MRDKIWSYAALHIESRISKLTKTRHQVGDWCFNHPKLKQLVVSVMDTFFYLLLYLL